MTKQGVLFNYKKYLPITRKTPMFTMGEGDTPLVRVDSLARQVGCEELYFKLEGCNPSGSFKDRGMVMAIAKAIEDGAKAVMCASTGNTSASAAAYAAYNGLLPIIIIPKGKIALGKLAQAIIFGAKTIVIDGNFDEALNAARVLTEKHPVALVNSINPYRIEGQKTASFEIIDRLGEAPDFLFIPVGNAGNITAYWKGFKEFHQIGKSKILPRMMGFQADGAAPIVRGHVIEHPETIATAIRIGNPASWTKATSARDESGGLIDMVSDDEILSAQKLLAAKGGIFGEPASAASLAGLLKLARAGTNFSGKRIVCVVTGNGLKDTEIALKDGASLIEVSSDLVSIEKALGW
jgi:threonine synthase